ncbi:hypothetical protein [Natrarchaeobius oligotrophus]|uniref:hypothetical protein n=1 Tax=Natrarchaeobius oligotrophus TaxID=3455743 RepID=UPI000F54A6CB|nr:hypothetical protein [Natrarchaeobius chitinivorans]
MDDYLQPVAGSYCVRRGGFGIETETVWSATTRTDVSIVATPRDRVPDDVDPIGVDALPDEAELAERIAREAIADDRVRRRRDRRQNYDLLVESLESARGDADEYYLTVDDAPVALDITSDSVDITDAQESAWYYVDELVVRRTEDEEIAPEDGDVVECLIDD